MRRRAGLAMIGEKPSDEASLGKTKKLSSSLGGCH